MHPWLTSCLGRRNRHNSSQAAEDCVFIIVNALYRTHVGANYHVIS